MKRVTCLLVSLVAVCSQAQTPGTLPSDIEGLRALMRSAPDRLTKALAAFKVLRSVPGDVAALSMAEQFTREAVTYRGPSPEVYENGAPVPNKLNPEFERFAIQRGEKNPREFGRVLNRDYAMIVTGSRAVLPRAMAFPLYLEGIKSPLGITAGVAATNAVRTENRDEIYKAFEVYLQRSADQPKLVDMLAMGIASKKAIANDARILEFFRSQGFLEKYQQFVQNSPAK